MTHTPETLPELVDQLHKEIEGKNIALAKRLEWIRKVEAINADLLAALKAALPILRQAHDRGFAIKEVEPVYNQAEAAIKQAEAK